VLLKKLRKVVVLLLCVFASEEARASEAVPAKVTENG